MSKQTKFPLCSALSSSPPNLSHFAGSKCYDAPAPTALPRPPLHWTTSGTSSGSTMPMTIPAAVPMVSNNKENNHQHNAKSMKKTHHSSLAKQHLNGSISSSGSGSSKRNNGNKMINSKQMTSCSRELLMVGAGAVQRSPNGSLIGAKSEFDLFSQNLKMVLNVGA